MWWLFPWFVFVLAVAAIIGQLLRQHRRERSHRIRDEERANRT